MERKPKPPTRLERAIMDAFEKSGMRQSKLSAASGLDQGGLSRFLCTDPQKRATLTLTRADGLCRVLGLQLVPKAKRKGK